MLRRLMELGCPMQLLESKEEEAQGEQKYTDRGALFGILSERDVVEFLANETTVNLERVRCVRVNKFPELVAAPGHPFAQAAHMRHGDAQLSQVRMPQHFTCRRSSNAAFVVIAAHAAC